MRRRDEDATREVQRDPELQPLVDLDLECILSAHVDDLKGGARRQDAQRLWEHLQTHFGDCKMDTENFVHTGIRHEHSSSGNRCHQFDYIAELKPMDVSHLKATLDEHDVDSATHGSYSSLLGGVAWTVLARADAAIYIQALSGML